MGQTDKNASGTLVDEVRDWAVDENARIVVVSGGSWHTCRSNKILGL